MTEEERQKLCNDLRAARPGYPPGELCMKAADEIEQLAEQMRKLTDELEMVRRDEERFIYD